MAFIDLDEFIYPKTNRSITEVVDEILSSDSNASGLLIHWQIYGSNGQEKADYSRGVLERFTRRAEKDFGRFETKKINNIFHVTVYGNVYLKQIANPRHIKEIYVHYAIYFKNYYSVNEQRIQLPETMVTRHVSVEKVAINHYFNKSWEEVHLKLARGRADNGLEWGIGLANLYDRNEVFDDGILKYRAARAENFSFVNDAERINRVTESLIKTLSQFADGEISDLETALTCRALSHYLLEKYPNDDRFKVFEEASLAAILNSLDGLKISEVRILIRELPNLLFLPYSIVAEIRNAVLQIISQMMQFKREEKFKDELADLHFLQLNYLRRLLEAWR